ncbi:MAG: hypothetical protein AAEI08_08715 [Gammaproteobacteria bacterium]
MDGVADGWPIDYQTLDPFYAENDRMTGVSGLAGDPAYPAKEPVMPPLPWGKSGEVFAKGFNTFGWHWWPADSAVATVLYDGRDKCIKFGACRSGCAQGAKRSADVTYWPHAIRNRVEVWARCRVREIAVDSKQQAKEGKRKEDAKQKAEGQEQREAEAKRTTVVSIRHQGGTYSGELSDGLPNGEGTWTKADGQQYVGQWKDSFWHGEHAYTGADGSTNIGKIKMANATARALGRILIVKNMSGNSVVIRCMGRVCIFFLTETLTQGSLRLEHSMAKVRTCLLMDQLCLETGETAILRMVRMLIQGAGSRTVHRRYLIRQLTDCEALRLCG